MKNRIVLDTRIKQGIPLAEQLLHILNHQWISDIIADDNNLRIALEFKTINGAEPWLELANVNGMQHVHFEINYDDAETFEFETTVAQGHENEVVEKIAGFIEESYDGKILTND